MFHVPATALLLTIVACTGTHLGLFLWEKIRRTRISRRWHLIPPLMAVPLLVGSFFALTQYWRHQGMLGSGRDWPYAEDSIPAEACKVHIDASYNNRRAKFSIESNALLSWCAQKKAKVERIGGESSIYRSVFDAEIHGNKEIEVTDGFVASDRWPNGGGFTIVYDATKRLAYYSWSTH